MNKAENDKCSQLDGKFCTLIPSRARGCSFQTAVLNSRPLCGELLPELMNEEKKLREKIEEQFAICGECEKTCKPKCRAVRVNAVLALFNPTPGELISDEEIGRIFLEHYTKKYGMEAAEPLRKQLPAFHYSRAIATAQARHTAQIKEGEIRELKETVKSSIKIMEAFETEVYGKGLNGFDLEHFDEALQSLKASVK